MDKNQLNNIIGFTFNFHQQCDVNWMDQDPSYIKEKWDKYIGTETLSNFIDTKYYHTKYYHLPQLLKNESISKWIRNWNISESEFLELKEVIYLISVLNTKAIIVPIVEGKYRVWDLESLIEEFSKFIDIEKVNKDLYNHQHALVKKEMVKWLNKTENKRAYNLNLLV